MNILSIFIDRNGGLNRNWKTIAEKNGITSIEGYNYDLKTSLQLALKGLKELPKCKTCGVEITLDKTYCNKKCSANDPEVKAKKLENTNIEERTKKISNALKGRSNENSWKARKEKYGQTGFSKEGLDKVKFNQSSLEKAKETVLEKYDVDNPYQIKHVREKISQLQTENNTASRHLPDWVYDKDLFTIEFNKGMPHVLEKSGMGTDLFYRLSFDYGLRDKSKSLAEIELTNFLNDLGVYNIELNTRKIIAPLELDVYIPEHNLAIEYNGLYWHSSNSKEQDKKLKTFHLNKTELCEEKGIHLLHIFEDEWLDPVKRNIWKSVIAHKLGKSKQIYARKCELKEISSKVANEFCELNHLQGKCNGISKALGLFYENELVQVATYGVPRYTKGYDYELLRLCSKTSLCVTGGASRLTKDLDLVSYANRRWSYGNVYEQIGFKKINVSAPCYFYIVDGKLSHRSSYMKHKLSKVLESFDPELTEVENCYNNGLRRIWDSGNIVYEKRRA